MLGFGKSTQKPVKSNGSSNGATMLKKVDTPVHYNDDSIVDALDAMNDHTEKLNDKLDKLIEVASRPQAMHPETQMLRDEQKERIKFLEGMVKELSNKPPQIQIKEVPVEKVVENIVEKGSTAKFDLNSLTKDELHVCAGKLTDAELLAIIRARKK